MSIGDTFEQYKIATNQLGQWLVNTARQRGHSISGLLDIESVPITTEGRYFVTYHDLSTLSRLVLQMTSPRKPPPPGLDWAILLAQSAIRGRRDCAAWYGGGDQGHRDFIDVLVSVQQDLRRARENSLVKLERRAVAPGSSSSKRPNIFEGLKLEEPTAGSVDGPRTALQTPDAKGDHEIPPENIIVELKRDDSDKQYQVFCYLQDCYEVRRVASSAWAELVNGQITLVTAGDVTYAATYLLEQLSAEFMKEFPDLNSMSKIQTYLDMVREESARLKNVQEEKKVANLPTLVSAESEDELPQADLECVVANELVKLTAMARSEGKPLFAKDFNLHRPGLKTGRILFTDVITRLGSLQECVPTEPNSEAIIGMDAITENLLPLFTSKVRPTCSYLDLVHRLQIYLDMYDVLGELRSQLPMLVNAYGSRIKLSLLHYDSALDTRSLPSSEQMVAGNVLSDDLLEELATIRDPQKTNLMQLPLYAATWNGSIMKLYHSGGLAICALDSSVLIMVHLYKALLAGKVLPCECKDLEWIIAEHGMDAWRLPQLNSQEPLLSAAKKYGQAMGVSRAQYTKNERHKLLAAQQRLPLPALSKKLKGLHGELKSAQKLNNHLYASEALYESLGFPIQQSTRHGLYTLAKEALSDDTLKIDDTIRAQWQSTKRLTSEQLMEIVKTVLKRDELALAFDYRNLVLNCTSILNGISIQWNTEIMAARSANGQNGAYRFRDMVDELLWGVAIDSQNQNDSKAKPQHCGLELFAKVGAYMEERIREIGSSCYDDALEMTGGNLEASLLHESNNEPPKAVTPETDLQIDLSASNTKVAGTTDGELEPTVLSESPAELLTTAVPGPYPAPETGSPAPTPWRQVQPQEATSTDSDIMISLAEDHVKTEPTNLEIGEPPVQPPDHDLIPKRAHQIELITTKSVPDAEANIQLLREGMAEIDLKIQQKQQEMEESRRRYEEHIAKIDREHEERMAELNREYEEKMAEIDQEVLTSGFAVERQRKQEKRRIQGVKVLPCLPEARCVVC